MILPTIHHVSWVGVGVDHSSSFPRAFVRREGIDGFGLLRLHHQK